MIVESTEDVNTEFEKLFNSFLTEIFKDSNIEELIQRNFVHLKKQVKNSCIPESGFTLNQIMHDHIKSHKLVLTRVSTYIKLPKWITKKKAVINSKNNK